MRIRFEEDMKVHPWLAILLLGLGGGCQTAQLQLATTHQATSVSDLYYDQILTNIAMLAEHPANLPYFSLPQSGQNTAQCSLTLNYTPTFELITSASRYLGRYLLDRQSALISGADTNIEGCDLSSARESQRFCLLADTGRARVPVGGGL
jgi:hypothetical protein